jgi:hypothetical protein
MKKIKKEKKNFYFRLFAIGEKRAGLESKFVQNGENDEDGTFYLKFFQERPCFFRRFGVE